MSRPKCSYHCDSCDRHFSTLAAFDTHRGTLDTGRRFCRDPGACELTCLDGVCEISGATVDGRPVGVEAVIWA